ncbi:GNAT family N-acetyltransferase [Nostoc sp. EfeVER01]|uniref:GNAT family N-acetyltransferase n=1 Tax=Nostoc sp. EfeVER01 TaxID=3075406 RepID=UPI003918F842
MNKNVSLTSFPRLETERLFLRQETPEDAPAVFTVFSDPKVTQFQFSSRFYKKK